MGRGTRFVAKLSLNGLPELLPVAMLLVTIGWVRRLWGPKKKQGHFCAECGYDLRATPARCPECGRVPSALEVSNRPITHH